MHEQIGESGENEGAFTDVDLQHIALLTGEGSYLHQLAATQSPDFLDELEKFLSTNRFTQAVQDLGDDALPDNNNKDKEPRQLPPITYVNPESILNGLKHIAALKHLIKIYTERTGNKVIIMQTDWSRDSHNEH